MQRFQSVPWKHDSRDDKFTEIAFGTPTLPLFPETLGRQRRPVKNQGDSLSCTAQGATLAAEYQDGVPLSAEFQWMQTCKKLGTAIPNGADYRTAFKILIERGALPQEKSPYTFTVDNYQTIGNWNAWPDYRLVETEAYKKAAYVKIPRVGDWFDSVKTALLRGKDKEQIVVACTRWFSEWNGKYIPGNDLYTNFAGYHCHTWIDFVTIDGREYLVGQNSYGEYLGDKGFQYWPRDTVNKELDQWGCAALVFEDLTEAQIQLAKQESFLGKIQRAILDIWLNITQRYGFTK